MMRNGLNLLVVLVSLVSANRASAEDRYYLMVFSYQRPVNMPRYSHSFATFIRLTDGGATSRLEALSISWMPQSLRVQCLRPMPERGQNLDLHSTLELAREMDTCVSMWGPYRIQPQLYQRALRQKTLLESGNICYKAVNSARAPDSCCNCIHAISDIVREEGRLPLRQCHWGDCASESIVYHLLPWIIEPQNTHDWIMGRLGLGRYAITPRKLAYP